LELEHDELLSRFAFNCNLRHYKKEVEELNTQLEELRTTFSEKTAEQKMLKDQAEIMERRLVAAEKLIAGLDSERTR